MQVDVSRDYIPTSVKCGAFWRILTKKLKRRPGPIFFSSISWGGRPPEVSEDWARPGTESREPGWFRTKRLRFASVERVDSFLRSMVVMDLEENDNRNGGIFARKGAKGSACTRRTHSRNGLSWLGKRISNQVGIVQKKCSFVVLRGARMAFFLLARLTHSPSRRWR